MRRVSQKYAVAKLISTQDIANCEHSLNCTENVPRYL